MVVARRLRLALSTGAKGKLPRAICIFNKRGGEPVLPRQNSNNLGWNLAGAEFGFHDFQLRSKFS